MLLVVLSVLISLLLLLLLCDSWCYSVILLSAARHYAGELRQCRIAALRCYGVEVIEVAALGQGGLQHEQRQPLPLTRGVPLNENPAVRDYHGRVHC